MYTFVWFSGAIWETPSKKTAVILSHLYVIGVKIVLRDNVNSYKRFHCNVNIYKRGHSDIIHAERRHRIPFIVLCFMGIAVYTMSEYDFVEYSLNCWFNCICLFC